VGNEANYGGRFLVKDWHKICSLEITHSGAKWADDRCGGSELGARERWRSIGVGMGQEKLKPFTKARLPKGEIWLSKPHSETPTPTTRSAEGK
jgi:hypothetical protein